MNIRYVLLLLLASSWLVGCGADPVVATVDAQGQQTFAVSARSGQLIYEPAHIQLATGTASDQVILTLDNQTANWQHNWVLLRSTDLAVAQQVAADARQQGSTAQFLPADRSDVLATTTLVEPGALATLRFALPPPGEYLFFCTVPGHLQGGQVGTLVVK